MANWINNLLDKIRDFINAIKPKGGWLHSRKLLIATSLIISIGCWIFVTLYVNADSQKTITDVPITIDTTAMKENFGLELIDIVTPEELENQKIDIVVKGSVYQISQVSVDDITVIAQTSSVNKAGEYTLALTLSCSNRSVTVALKNGYSSINVWFDSKRDKNITLDKPLVNGVLTPTDSNLVVGDCIGSITAVTVRGPESVINMLTTVQLRAEVKDELAETTEIAATICYLDADGVMLDEKYTEQIEIIDYNGLEESTGTAAGAPASGDITVTVPIRMECELPIRLTFKNIPEGFDESTLKYSLSTKTIKLEGNIDAIQTHVDRGYYPIEAIDLQALEPGNTRFVQKIDLGTALESPDNITEIVVTFNLSGYTTQTLAVNKDRITLVNAGGGTATVMSDTINVTITGPSKYVSGIDAGNISLLIDMANDDWTAGTRTKTATVVIGSNSNCWAVGTYSVKVKVG